MRSSPFGVPSIVRGLYRPSGLDFRHTATTNMRKKGVQPKLVSDILGHERVNLAMDIYDRTDSADLAVKWYQPGGDGLEFCQQYGVWWAH